MCQGNGFPPAKGWRSLALASRETPRPAHPLPMAPGASTYQWDTTVELFGTTSEIVFEVHPATPGEASFVPIAVGVLLIDGPVLIDLADGPAERWLTLYDPHNRPAGHVRVRLAGRFDPLAETCERRAVSTQTAHPALPPSPETVVPGSVFAPIRLLGPFYGRLFDELITNLELDPRAGAEFAHLLAFKARSEAERMAWHTEMVAALRSMGMAPPLNATEKLLFVDQILVALKRFVQPLRSQHCYSRGRNLIGGYEIRAVICGPRGSGKSTVLQLLLSEILLKDALHHHWWGDCLLLPVNWALLLWEGVDLSHFFCQWVQHLVTLLVIHRPPLRPYAAAVAHYWHQLIAQRHLPPVPPELVALHGTVAHLWRPRAQRLMDAYHGNQFGAFLRVCMELPELFKQSFEFDRLLFVFDHWELTAVRFGDHWADGSPVTDTVRPYVLEQMRRHHLVCTSCDPPAAAGPGAALRDTFDDLVPNVSRFSTIGLISNDVLAKEFSIVPARIDEVSSGAIFAGCPGYVARFIRVALGSQRSGASEDELSKKRQTMEFYGRAVEHLLQKAQDLEAASEGAEVVAWAQQLPIQRD